MEIPASGNDITGFKERFLYVYTYPFTLGPDESVKSSPLEIDPVIVDFCILYQVTLGQITPSFWRIVLMLRHFTEEIAGKFFTLNHLVRLYRPRLYQGFIKLRQRSKKPFFTSVDEGKDRGWISRFVRVQTSNIIPVQWNSGTIGVSIFSL